MMRQTQWTGSDLDRKVQIAQPIKTTDADTGYDVITYGTEDEVPAFVQELPISREREVAGGLQYDKVIRVVIRYKSEYESTNIRLRYKNQYYDVIEAREGWERRRWLILECRYGGKQLNR